MTAVAFKDGILAADSLATKGNMQQKHDKIEVMQTRSYGKCAVAIVGSTVSTEMLKTYLKHGGKFPDFESSDGSVIIFMTESGKLYEMYARSSTPSIIQADENYSFQSQGSGSSIAYGAMAAGATAVEAIKTACELADGCGGDVLWVDCRKMKVNRIKQKIVWSDEKK